MKIYRMFHAYRVLLLLLACLLPMAAPNGANAKRLVVLISIDGFKPDYANRGATPTLDTLAATGASARGLVPQFPSVTFPNHYSLVTGLVPDHHGIVNNTMFDPTIPGRPFALAFRDVMANPAWWEDATPIWVTLRRSGKRSSTLFWPGSETLIHGIQPDDWLPYDDALTSQQRVDKLLAWLDRPEAERADFATLYFSEVDTMGHRFGPDAVEVVDAVKRVDAALASFILGLQRLGIRDDATLVVVSDHGMAEVTPARAINIKTLLEGIPSVQLQWGGPVAGFAVHPDERSTALARLAAQPNMMCWPKTDIPTRLRLGTHRRVPDVVCLADLGWTITDGRPFPRGQHGYDPADPQMWGLFIAAGSRIASRKLDLVDSIDVYPLLCALLGVSPERSDASPSLVNELMR